MNSDPNQQASGGGAIEQVFCPNCRGGNAPNATTCQWCGNPLTAASSPVVPVVPVSTGYTAQPQYAPTSPQQPVPVYTPQQVNVAAAPRRGLPIWLWVMFGLIALCMVGGIFTYFTLVNFGRNAARAITNISATAQAGVTKDDNTGPVSASMGVGQTGESGNLRITLNGVRRESRGAIDPGAGKEYVIVSLTVENTGKSDETVSSLLSMTLRNEAGHRYSIAFGADKKGDSLDGSVVGNGKLEGEVAFEVPVGQKGLVFSYEPFLSNDGAVRFNIDR